MMYVLVTLEFQKKMAYIFIIIIIWILHTFVLEERGARLTVYYLNTRVADDTGVQNM